jgi:enoyl-CoA hydratase
VTVTVADEVAWVVLDRPPVNAVDTATLAALRDAFLEVGDDRAVRAAVFTAAGERAFMAGADLDSVAAASGDASASNVTDPGRVAREAMWAVTDCGVPVIGAINGPAIGAGVAFAACCDMLLAADHAVFATKEIDVGLLGASAHLSLLVGRHKAREMFFLGEEVSAEELHRLGAVRQVVPRGELEGAARALALRLAAKSPIALRLAKESMARVEGLPLKDAYRIEQDYTARLLTFDDATEARDAYRERRAPVWRWR